VYQGQSNEETSMRHRRSVLAVLGLVLSTLLFAPPTWAGGPTSVLLVEPHKGRTASLYTTDADYQLLARLVGASGGGGGERVDQSEVDHSAGPGITVTWLIHDVGVWRVDRIYLKAEGGPWISTQSSYDDSGAIWNAPAVWHTSTDGANLRALLEQLGFTNRGSRKSGGTGAASGIDVVDKPPPVAAAEVPTKADQLTGATTAPPNPWGWGLAGLVGGIILTMATRRLRTRVRPTTDRPVSATPPEEDRLEANGYSARSLFAGRDG
jgi:hypothetical protein